MINVLNTRNVFHPETEDVKPKGNGRLLRDQNLKYCSLSLNGIFRKYKCCYDLFPEKGNAIV